jgi:hypothetical protein
MDTSIEQSFFSMATAEAQLGLAKVNFGKDANQL